MSTLILFILKVFLFVLLLVIIIRLWYNVVA